MKGIHVELVNQDGSRWAGYLPAPVNRYITDVCAEVARLRDELSLYTDASGATRWNENPSGPQPQNTALLAEVARLRAHMSVTEEEDAPLISDDTAYLIIMG